MPIEIKELHIHIVVNTASESTAGKAQSGAVGNNSGNSSGGDKDAIVAECVEQVLEILQSKRER